MVLGLDVPSSHNDRFSLVSLLSKFYTRVDSSVTSFLVSVHALIITESRVNESTSTMLYYSGVHGAEEWQLDWS